MISSGSMLTNNQDTHICRFTNSQSSFSKLLAEPCLILSILAIELTILDVSLQHGFNLLMEENGVDIRPRGRTLTSRPSSAVRPVHLSQSAQTQHPVPKDVDTTLPSEASTQDPQPNEELHASQIGGYTQPQPSHCRHYKSI